MSHTIGQTTGAGLWPERARLGLLALLLAALVAGCGAGGGGGPDGDADLPEADADRQDADPDRQDADSAGPDADAEADAEAESDAEADADDLDGDADGDEDLEPPAPGPFVILHLTDVHIGAQAVSAPALAFALGEVRDAVRPAVTVVTGDLTDEGTDTAQWLEYADLTSAVSFADYHDVPGNHDAHDVGLVGYLGYSVAGRATAGRHGHRIVEAAGRAVRIVGTNTASADNETTNLTGYLDPAQVDALLASIGHDTRPVDFTVVLGHHPMRGLNGLDFRGTGDDLRRLLDGTAASAYLYGHVHLNARDFVGEVLHVESPTLGKPEWYSGWGVSVLVLDDDGPALRRIPLEGNAAEVRADWPVVVITQPGDADLAGGNPVATPLGSGSAGNLLRAVVCSPTPPESVSFRLAGGDWQPMAETGGWFEATFDAPAGTSLRIEVQAVAGGLVDTHAIRVHLI